MIWFEELTGSPKAQLTAHNGHSFTRVFRVAWENSNAFAELLFARSFPGYTTSYPQTVAIEPFLGEGDLAYGDISDPADATAQYPWAKVTATYGTTLWGAPWPSEIPVPNHDTETILTLKTRISGQFLSVPARSTHYEDTTPGDEDKPVPPEDQMNRILIPLIDYNVHWDWVADPPRNKLRDLLGKVNEATFMGCEPETLLFEGSDINESFRPATDPRCFSVDVVLKQRRIDDDGTIRGWNHEYREDPAGWQKIKLSDGTLRYPVATFDDMFEQ